LKANSSIPGEVKPRAAGGGKRVGELFGLDSVVRAVLQGVGLLQINGPNGLWLGFKARK